MTDGDDVPGEGMAPDGVPPEGMAPDDVAGAVSSEGMAPDDTCETCGGAGFVVLKGIEMSAQHSDHTHNAVRTKTKTKAGKLTTSRISRTLVDFKVPCDCGV